MLELPASKAGWTRVAFGEVVRKVNDKVDPWDSGLERYVAGEHMVTDDLRIRRWGLIGDDYLGPAFHMRFKPGQVLYGSRRTYLRKVALPDFEGITANTTFVLETKDSARLMAELLPFVMQTEAFHTYSIKHSKGSVNPYINYSDLEAFEFILPPIEEQARLVEMFLSFESAREALRDLSNKSRELLFATFTELLHQHNLLGLSPASEPPAPGWRHVTFNDVCERVTYGFTNPMPTTDVGPWMVTAKDVADGAIDYTSARHTSRHAFENDLTEKSRVRGGDVLLTKDGTLGRVAVVDRDDICINQSVAVLRPNELSSGVFLSKVLRAPQMQARLMKDSGGSAVKHLYITKVGETRFFLPSIEEQSRISSILNSLEERVSAADKRLSDLDNLKKSVLEGKISHAL